MANQFLPFAGSASAVVLSQVDYAADAEREIGNTPNTEARAELVNKALRQGTVMAAGIGQFLSDVTGRNINDDGDPDTITDAMKVARQWVQVWSGLATSVDPSALSCGDIPGLYMIRSDEDEANVSGVVAYDGSTESRQYASFSSPAPGALVSQVVSYIPSGGFQILEVAWNITAGTVLSSNQNITSILRLM